MAPRNLISSFLFFFFLRMDFPSSFVVELAETSKEARGKSLDDLTAYLPARLAKLALKYIHETFRDSITLPDSAERDLKYLAGLETIAKVEDEDTIRRHVKAMMARYVENLIQVKGETIVKKPGQFKLAIAKLGLGGEWGDGDASTRSLTPDGNVLVFMEVPSSCAP